MELTAPVSAGELIDKITILAIKAERIADESKLANIRNELAALEAVRDGADLDAPEFHALVSDLRSVNEELWIIEDEIRAHERDSRFDERFIELARSVYRTNDRRAALKRAINERAGSAIVEEKSYEAY